MSNTFSIFRAQFIPEFLQNAMFWATSFFRPGFGKKRGIARSIVSFFAKPGRKKQKIKNGILRKLGYKIPVLIILFSIYQPLDAAIHHHALGIPHSYVPSDFREEKTRAPKSMLPEVNIGKDQGHPERLWKQYTFGKLDPNATHVLDGYRSTQSVFFPVPSHAQIQKSSVHLILEVPGQVDTQSTLELEFNGQHVMFIPLIPNAENRLIKDVPLPVNLYANGWQHIELKARFFSAKTGCNPNLMLHVSPESVISIEFTQAPIQPKLSSLPYPLIDPSALDATESYLVLPNHPSWSEFFSALRFVSWLGQQHDSDKVILNTAQVDTFNDQLAKTGNVILIGNMDALFDNPLLNKGWPAFLRDGQVQDHNGRIDSGVGLLMMIASPWNSNFAALSMTGTTEQGLIKASQSLQLNSVPALGNDQIIKINQVMIEHSKSRQSQNWSNISLQQLGLAQQSVLGLGRQEISYVLSLPNDKIPHSFEIKTHLNHPDYLASDHAEVNLLLNGELVASTSLIGHAQIWDVIATDVLPKAGKNVLTYQFNLNRQDQSCGFEDHLQSWATVSDKTELSLSFLDKLPPQRLSDFPVPFGEHTLMVLPTDANSHLIGPIIKLYYKFSQLFSAKYAALEIIDSASVNETMLQNHPLILLGTKESNPWIEKIQRQLPVHVINHQRIFKDIFGNEAVLDSTQSLGLIEEIHSPWNKQYPLLVITGTDNNALERTMTAFLDGSEQKKWLGNTIVVHADHHVSVLTVHDNTTLYTILGDIRQMTVIMYLYIKLYPSLFIFLISFIVFAYFAWRRDR